MPRSWPPQLDAPSTDLGQLQRGLGSVARRAFAGAVEGLADMVLACVAADPRWDQVDNRVYYYARLAIHAGVSPSVFESMAATEEAADSDGDAGASLALDVMSRMAALGDPEALKAARRYVGAGRYWDEVLLDLSHGPGRELHPDWEERVGDLGPALARRWATEGEMVEAIGWLFGIDPDAAPWSALSAEQPALRRALEGEVRAREGCASASPWEPLARLSTVQLLEHGDHKDVRDAARALASRSFTVAELACLRRIASDRAAPMQPAAVSTLARLGHVEVLEAAVEFRSARNPGRRLLFEAFRDLPMEATRPYVREWLNGQDDYRRRAAASALGRHATPADLASVRERLTTETARGLGGEQYVICSLASALERHPSHGPFPELVAAYEAMPYSFGRHSSWMRWR